MPKGSRALFARCSNLLPCHQRQLQTLGKLTPIQSVVDLQPLGIPLLACQSSTVR